MEFRKALLPLYTKLPKSSNEAENCTEKALTGCFCARGQFRLLWSGKYAIVLIIWQMTNMNTTFYTLFQPIYPFTYLPFHPLLKFCIDSLQQAAHNRRYQLGYEFYLMGTNEFSHRNFYGIRRRLLQKPVWFNDNHNERKLSFFSALP